MEIRSRIENQELRALSPYGFAAAKSAGRVREEPPDPVRTAFQRDKDRILHSKSFRRLKHKTQVFIDPRGDHYRTRLTHTLEVSQVARTIGRGLMLNEDLIEAIALGHDVGHSPFGHAGETALDEAMRSCGVQELDLGFRHHEQSLRILDVLEHLNLSEEVRLGIGGHSKGEKNLSSYDGEPVSTLEAAVVRISDRVAYLNHDLDDAIRSGMISDVPDWIQFLGDSHGHRVGYMVEEIIYHSWEQPRISMSGRLLSAMNDLKDWLFENVYYKYPVLYPEVGKAKSLVAELFYHYLRTDNLPPGYKGPQGAVDYVAGMTDRFAVASFSRLRLPVSWRDGELLKG